MAVRIGGAGERRCEIRSWEKGIFGAAAAAAGKEGMLKEAFAVRLVLDIACVGLDLASRKAWLRLRFNGRRVLAEHWGRRWFGCESRVSRSLGSP